MSPLPSPPTSLIGKCLRRSGPKQRGKILESYAADVVIACRILGPRAAGASLGVELFGEKGAVTATPILKVVAMVESGEIPVTKEQLLAVVQQDESAMRFCESNPWIVDPTGQSAPPAKKGRKPGTPEFKTIAVPEVKPTTPVRGEQRTTPESKNSKRAKKTEGEKKPGNAPPRLTSDELRKLSQQESEHQRQAFQPKKNEPKPPVFRGTPPPPMKASNEELEEWRRIRKREIADHIVASKELGWEIPADWDGLTPVHTVATRIGQPSA